MRRDRHKTGGGRIARRLTLLLSLLLPVTLAAQAAPPAALIADRVRVEPDQRLVAEGSVEVIYGTTRLKASRITFDRAAGRLTIDGPITLLDGDSTVILADAAALDTDLRNGILTSARVVLDQQLQLAAAQARRVDGRYTELSKTVASSCQVCAANPVALWSIRARRVIHDQVTQQLYFDHATFRILDVPVLYLPRLRLPGPTVKRATGFLIPDVRSTSDLGTGIKIPYFIALGPSRDLTFTPYLSPHTRTLQARYRQAFRHGRIAFAGAVSSDDIRPAKTRGYLFGQGAFDLPAGFLLSFGIETTSDAAYLLDYGYSGKDRLTSFARIDRVRRDRRISARLINFRTLRDSEIPIADTIPYLLGSALYERRILGLGGGIGRLAFSLQGHQRTSTADIAGRDVLRAGLVAEWQRRAVVGPGIEASLIGRLTVDDYRIDQDTRFASSLTTATPAVGLTLRWPFARHWQGTTETLTPLLQLAYSARVGDRPPNEDATLVEFDEGNLLSLDRYPGHDRHESGPRAALGLTYARYDPSGWTASATLGRLFRASADPGFTAASGLDGAASDWLAALRLSFGTKVSVTTRTLVGPELDVSKSETRIDWAGDRLNLSAAYIFVREDLAEDRLQRTNEITFATDYRLALNWTGSAGLRYDVAADRAAYASVGLGYRNECASLNLSLSRRFTSSTSVSPTTDVGLKVSLGGFGGDRRAYRRSCAVEKKS